MDDYKYSAIVDWAKKYILENNLEADARFLSENDLCAIHNVSRQTVRQALKVLESEGVIVRMRGSGTFVKAAEPKPEPSSRQNVGIISTYFSDYIFPSIITGIEGVLKQNNIGIQLAITHNRVFEETQAIENMLTQGICGLIIEPSKSALPNPNIKLYEEIKARNIPIVFFNAKYPWSDAPCIAMDDVLAGKIVTDHLFNNGHRNISAIFSLDDMQGHNRYHGFMNSCEEHGLKTAEQNVIWYSTAERDDLFTVNEKKIQAMLDNSTAVVCYNDKLAVDLLGFCRQKGLSVPDDISVVGIDNSKLSTICDIPLTTVQHPHQELGKAAAEKLVSIIRDPLCKCEDVIFTPQLITRDSVRRIGRSAR